MLAALACYNLFIPAIADQLTETKGCCKKNRISTRFHIGRNKCHCPTPRLWSDKESSFHGVSLELCSVFGGLTIYMQCPFNVSRSFHSRICYCIFPLFYHQALFPENVYVCPVSKSCDVIYEDFSWFLWIFGNPGNTYKMRTKYVFQIHPYKGRILPV